LSVIVSVPPVKEAIVPARSLATGAGDGEAPAPTLGVVVAGA
jgi:hypothetical protein